MPRIYVEPASKVPMTLLVRAAWSAFLIAVQMIAAGRAVAQVNSSQRQARISAVQLLETAHTLFAQGDLENARKYYLQVLPAYPRNFEILKNLGYCYYSKGRTGFAKAAQYYSQAYEINPRAYDVAEKLAICLKAVRRPAEAAAVLGKLAENPNAPAEVWRSLAEDYVQAGRAAEAEGAYDVYLERKPGDLQARTDLGNFYGQQKDYSRALEQFRIALTANPNLSAALIGAARIRAWQGQYGESVRLYDRVLRLSPSNGVAATGKAFVLLWMGRVQEAESLFSELHRRFPRDGEVQKGLQTARAAIEENALAEARRTGNIAQVESFYRQRLAEDPNDSRALTALATLAADSKRCSDSVAFARRALEISPGDPSTELSLARSLALCQQYPEAIARYGRYVSSHSDDEGALYGLGDALRRARLMSDAIEVFRKVLALNPQNSDAQLGLGLALASTKQYDEALVRFDEVLKNSGENYDALQAKAFILYWRGQYGEARPIFQRLAVERPTDSQNGQTLDAIAQAEEEARWAALRPPPGAPTTDFLAYYEKRLASYPDDISALKQVASIQEQLNNFPAAVHAYERVLEKQPHDPDVSTRLARLLSSESQSLSRARSLALSGKTNRSEALRLLKEHLERAPDDTEARVFYGSVLSWEGRYGEAREQLRQVLAKNPGHGDALPALINVELWSDHPEEAARLAHEARRRKPSDADLLMAEVHALRNMRQDREAKKVLDGFLASEPKNRQAREARWAIERASGNYWQFAVDHTYDFFSDGRAGQHETSMSSRIPTRTGSVTVRLNRADRFSQVSYQTELDYYPSIRSGTYGYINLGYSADANLYPRYRVGSDLFQSLGHGYEMSGGYRRLHFSSNINIYTFSLAKYRGNWLFTGRGFLTPDELGISRTGVFSARRFFSSEGLHDYIEFFYSRGASLAQARTTLNIELLDSYRFGLSVDKTAGHWGLAFKGGVSQEQRLRGGNLRRYSLQGSVVYRF